MGGEVKYRWWWKPTWVGYEAANFGGRRIEGFGLLTEDGRRCWLTSERRFKDGTK